MIKYKSSRLIPVFLKILTFCSYQKSIIRTIENSSVEFLPTLEVSSRSHINTTCCLRYYTGHSTFAQILNVFIKKLTSLRLFLKITVTQKFFSFLYEKVLGQNFYEKRVVLKASKKELICVFPFLGKKSMQLRARLVSYIESKLKFCKLKSIFQSPCKLNPLFRYKDPLQKKICSDIVYRYMCITARLLIIVKHTTTFLLELQSIWMFLI